MVDFGSEKFLAKFAETYIRRRIHPWPEQSLDLSMQEAMSGVAPLLQPVEDVIRTELKPPMLGCGVPGDPERAMLAFPARLGGLSPTSTVHLTDCYDHSVKLTAPLAELTKELSLFLGDIPAEQQVIKQQVYQERRAGQVTEANRLKASLTQSLHRSLSLSAERGASAWLSASPRAAHGFYLSK